MSAGEPHFRDRLSTAGCIPHRQTAEVLTQAGGVASTTVVRRVAVFEAGAAIAILTRGPAVVPALVAGGVFSLIGGRRVARARQSSISHWPPSTSGSPQFTRSNASDCLSNQAERQ